MPYVVSLPDYEAIARECGFGEIKTADWSVAVAPFWDRVIESAFDPQVLWALGASGAKNYQCRPVFAINEMGL
ncbi:hypothetical protein NON20_04985 [Synechocystis sp. B12]|nr:hypothetical protein NON20_04985 [Synechocystis sp. B12]